MNDTERNFLARRILFDLLDNNQELAIKVAQHAVEISARCNAQRSAGTRRITPQEIKELLDPWVRHTPEVKATM